MKAVSLFDYTGVMLEPWAEAGYDCHAYDIQHEFHVEGNITFHKADLATARDLTFWDDVAFVSSFPPCTNTSLSGARWMKGKGLRALQESISYFATSSEYCEKIGAPYCIENPKSITSSFWREPDHKFHPCHYSGYVDGAEDYTKETWLWVGNGFVMPPPAMKPDLFNKPDATYIHHQPPGPERANIRSATPKGFARAVFEVNQ